MVAKLKGRQVAAIFGILLGAALLAAGWLGPRGLGRFRRTLARYYRLGLQVEGLQAKNVALQQQIERLKNDRFWLEKQVRERLGWVKPGEVVYKFRDVQSDGTDR